MYSPQNEVLTQFKGSENLLGMMTAHSDEYNLLIETFDKFIDAYSLDKAQGTQLDALGFLIGLERPLTRDLDRYFTFFGGTGKGFGNRFGTVDGGEFIGYTESGLALANDKEYRELLYLKLFSNLSRVTPDDVIATVNSITKTQCIYREGNEAGDNPATIVLEVLGADDPVFKEYLEKYIAKPLGVELRIVPYIILRTAIETQKYTGTSSITNLTTTVDMTYGLSYIKNVTGNGGNMIVSSIMGEQNAISLSDTDASRDIGVQYVYESDTVIISDSADANKLDDEYMLFSLSLPTREVTQSSDMLSSEYAINNITGFGIVEWTGSGSEEQHIRLPFEIAPSLIISKSMAGSDTIMSGDALNGFTLKVNSDEPATTNKNPDVELLSAGMAVKRDFNIKGKKYFGWIFNQNKAYSIIDIYKSKGLEQAVFTTGFEPTVLMIKRTDSNGDWLYFSKDLLGAMYPMSIRMNSDAPALDDEKVEITADGFKLLTTDSDMNELGGEYTYIAIRE